MNTNIAVTQNIRTRTPNQAIREFYTCYDQETVTQILTWVFGDYTAMAGKGKPQYDENIARFVNLFDHLIALTGAIETLQQKGTKGKCIICNRAGNPPH